MIGWWLSVIPAGLVMIVHLIVSGSQRERNAATRRDATTAQVRRAIDLEKSMTGIRARRWYDSAAAYAIVGTPMCQWLFYHYKGSAIAIILPLMIFVVLHVGINGFHPYAIPHTPVRFSQYSLRIGVLGSVLTLAVLVPSSPGIIATRVALLDLIGVLVAGIITTAIRSAGLHPASRSR